jgi:hypothetical protein
MEQGITRIPTSFSLKNDVPREVKRLFLLNVRELKDLLSYCSVDKSYSSICNDDNFWKEKYNQDFPHTERLTSSKKRELSWKRRYIEKYAEEHGHKYGDEIVDFIKTGSLDGVKSRVEFPIHSIQISKSSIIGYINLSIKYDKVDIFNYLIKKIKENLTLDEMLGYLDLAAKDRSKDITALLLDLLVKEKEWINRAIIIGVKYDSDNIVSFALENTTESNLMDTLLHLAETAIEYDSVDYLDYVMFKSGSHFDENLTYSDTFLYNAGSFFLSALY